MLFKKDELRYLWPFYMYLLVYGLSTMILPFLVIYFIKLGFSYFQISIITAAFGFSMFLFEIPTGAFADGFSRKYSVIIGSFIIAISVTLIPLTTNFYLIVFLWGLSGMGMTCISGAEEAWVIDNLNKEGRKDLHQEFFIKSSSFIALGSIFAPIIGALLVKNNSLEVLWYIFGFGFFLSAILMLLFTKEHFVPVKLKPADLIKKSYSNCKEAFRFSMNNRVIFLSFMAGLFMQLMFLGRIGIQPFLLSLGMPEYQLGYLYSITAAVGVVMSFLSRHFVKYKPKNVMSVVVLIHMILLLSLLFIYPPFFLAASVIFIMKDGLLYFGIPVIQTYFHKFIPETIRATTMSTKSMLDQLLVALSSLIAGVFLDICGPKLILAFGSLFGIFAVILYQKIKD